MNDIFPKKGVSGIGSDLSRALVAAKLAGGVMVIDRNFRVVMIDRKAAEFCRVSSGQSQGKRFYALFPSLMGSALSGELHDVFGTACTKRWTRPADNKLLDQFVDAFGRERAALISISLEAFEDLCINQVGAAENSGALRRRGFKKRTSIVAPCGGTDTPSIQRGAGG
jgi:hypothetical protein